VNDGIEEPKRRDHFSAEALDDGWVSWNLKDPTRFNAFIEPLTVRAEPPTSDGRPCARVRMVPERKHSNLGDNVHGAVTLALVDIALFAASHQFGSLNAGHSVTLDLSTQFVDYAGTDKLLILSGNYDLGNDKSISGRIVQAGDDINAYVALRRSGNAGMEYFLILGDPNRFDGEVCYRPLGAEGWETVTPGFDTTVGRGIGLADMIEAIRSDRPHRASGELGFHVLDVLLAIEEATISGRVQAIGSRVDRPDPLG